MSFAEFQIRLFAWKRTEERSWEKVRFSAWCALTGFHQDPKKMPKSLTQFLPLSLDKKHGSKVSDAQKELFLLEYQKYLNNLKNV